MQITLFLVVFNLSKLSPAEYNTKYKSSCPTEWGRDWRDTWHVTRDTWPGLWWCLLLTLLESSKLREVSHDVCTLQPLQANWECLAACVESPCQTSHFPQSSAGRPKQGCKLYSENSRQHCRQGKYSATPLSCWRSKESLLHNTIYLFWTNSRETFVFFNG